MENFLIAATDPSLPVVGGAASAAVILVGYLLRELNKSSGGAWRVVREKNRLIHQQAWEIRSLRHQLAVAQDVNPGPDPGLYEAPSEEELRTW